MACSVKQNKGRKEVRLYQYNEVTMGYRGEKHGRTIKFKDSFSKATLAEDRLVPRTFSDSRAMVFRENSSNRSWNKVKSLNVSFKSIYAVLLLTTRPRERHSPEVAFQTVLL